MIETRRSKYFDSSHIVFRKVKRYCVLFHRFAVSKYISREGNT